jgi:predicted phage tail protein
MSKIKVIVIGADTESFEFHADSLKEVLSLMQLQKGEEFVSSLIKEEHKFILANEKDYENMIALTPEVIFSSFEGFTDLYIIKEIEGEEPISLGVSAAAALGATGAAATAIAYAVTLVVLIAVSMAVSAIMSAISPTPEFGKDPSSQQQESNLFNSAPIVRNQGGSVPLIFGNPYCGAVLISSGLFSEEVTV